MENGLITTKETHTTMDNTVMKKENTRKQAGKQTENIGKLWETF